MLPSWSAKLRSALGSPPFVGRGLTVVARCVALLLLLVSRAAVLGSTGSEWQRDPILSSLLIQTMVTDRAGFRWVATDDGVYRYDGYELTPLAAFVRRGPRFPLAQVGSLALDRRGRLWIGSSAGLFCFTPDSGQLLAIRLPTAIRVAGGAGVAGLCYQPRTGIMWVNVGPYVFALHPDGSLEPLFPPRWAGGGYHFQPAADGGVWLISDQNFLAVAHLSRAGRLQRLGVWQRAYPIPNSLPARFFDVNGLFEVTAAGERRTIATWPVPLPAWPHLAPACTDSTVSYVAWHSLVQLTGLRGGRPRAGISAFAPVAAPPGLGDGYLLQQDAAGIWWTWSAYWRGCFKRRDARRVVQPVRQANGQPLSSTRAVGRLPDGRLFVSTYAGSFVQAADSATAPLRPYAVGQQGRAPVPRRESSYLALLALPRTGLTLLAGESNGLMGIEGATGKPVVQPATTHPTTALLRDGRGRIWVGTTAGLFEFDLTRQTLRRYGDALPGRPLTHLAINHLAADPANHGLWLATGQGLFWLQPDTGTLRHFGTDHAVGQHLPTDALVAVATDGPGRAWVGTRDQGLLLVDVRTGLVRQLTVGDGLPSYNVVSILLDGQGHVWAGTYGGLARYTPATGQVVAFREAEGLPNAELNRWAAFRDHDGSLWFGGIGGVVHFQPQLVTPDSTQRPARLLVAALGQTDGTTVRTTPLVSGRVAPLRLDAATPGAFVELRLALTDLFAPELAHYAYRLLDPGGQPQSAWLATPRALLLRGLTPGDYQIEVRAETALGQRAANRLRVPLHVVAPWWQWPAVWALAAVLLVAVGYGLYGIRLWRVRRNLARRAALAANLHDEMGALLTRVNLLAEVLRDQYQPTPSPAGEPSAFDRLLHNSRAAAQTIRDVVWGIDSRADSAGALVARMQSHLDQSVPLAGIAVRFRASGLPATLALPPEVRQHLYLIFKEAVTNALRHAVGATELRISLERATNGQLTLEVLDDGLRTPPAGTPAGMGLRNMRQRAQAIGAVLETGPRPDGRPGFRVWVRG